MPSTSQERAARRHEAEDYDLVVVGARMRARRRELALTQVALALRVVDASAAAHCVDRRSISFWEHGEHHVALAKRKALASALEMTPTKLFGK